MYPEYDPNEPTLGQSFANMLRGFQNPQAYQEAGKSLLNAVQLTPNVTESLGRGGVAQAIGTTGDLRDLRNTIQSYLPKSVQNFSNAAEFMTNPYAKALIQAAPTTEQTLETVPRVTAPYESYKQHETLGEYIAPSLGYFGSKVLKATKDLPIGMTIQDVTPPIEPAKVAEALRQPEKNALGFYSPLDEAVMNLQNQKGTGQQYLAQLLKTQGVKQEEVATRGLDTFLESNPKVTKTQIQEFLGENPVQLKETVLGVPEKFDADRLKQLETEYAGLKEHAIDDPSFGENKYDEMIRLQNIRDNSTLDSLYARAEADEKTAQRMQQLGLKDEAEKYFRQAELLNTRAEKLDLEELGPVLPTKFGKPDFNIPNGENYREVLIQYPNLKSEKFDPSKVEIVRNRSSVTQGTYTIKYNGKEIQTYGDEFNANDGYKGLSDNEIIKTAKELYEKGDIYNNVKPMSGEFVNRNHFEQPNILTHMRVDDRVIDGKKTLFIQEIQSDWHQKGRKEGYATPETKRLKGTVEEQISEYGFKPEYKVNWEDGTFSGGYGSREAAEAKAAEGKSNAKTGVPDAPFKNTEQWAGLAMKRAMQMAAEGGYDRIAFTTGKQQADRYNLRKSIEELHYSGSDLVAYDGNGNKVISQTGVRPEDLPDLVGKEAAEKLLNQPKQGTLQSLTGQDLEVGGEGMTGFYDKILPTFINKYGKKHGLKVGTTEMPINAQDQIDIVKQNAGRTYGVGSDTYNQAVKNQYETVHYFDLTPEAKESFLKKGQPMFAAAPAIGITDEDTRREVLEKLFNSKK
jgi:hypothetical protein